MEASASTSFDGLQRIFDLEDMSIGTAKLLEADMKFCIARS